METLETSLRIIELTAENVKRLKAITIRPDTNRIVIGGKNGAGKSSTLDAIAYALGGKTLIPEEPIRKGEKSAKVRVDLGEFVVERRFTASGSTLTVMSKEGAKYPSPQAILDRLVGNLSFDPLAFVSMKPEAQLETLKQVLGVNFDDLEGQRKATYDERTLVNKEVKQLEGELAGLALHNDAPEQPVSIETLLAELKQIEEHNRSLDKAEADGRASLVRLANVDSQIENCNAEIADLQRRFERLQKQKTELKASRSQLEEVHQKQEHATNALGPRKEPADILADIQQVETVNQKFRENQHRGAVHERLTAKRAEADRLSESLEQIEKQKEQRLSEAKFPVTGLSFAESGVLLNGLPFNQASAAEQLRVSVAMGMAMNPRLKILLVRDGSLLDEDNLALLTKVVETAGYQLWLEKVGAGKEVSVVIEDGEIAV